MSSEARKVFDVEEQEAKEVITVIKAVAPVISLIRDWGRYEKEFYDVTHKLKELKKIIDAMKITIESVKDNSLKQQLQIELHTRIENYDTYETRERNLRGTCTIIEKQVILYRKYARNHGWVTLDNLKKALKLEPFEEYEDLLSIMFFVYNRNSSNSSNEKEKLFIEDRYSINNEKSSFIFKDWNEMLESLKSNLI